MSTEAKLAQMLSEMNEARSGGNAGNPICETECTMARIRSYSDFLYILRVKPIQTMCYYGAGAFLLLTLSALWCMEWLLAAVFAVIFIILATLPHNMRIHYFNRQADDMEQSYGKVINAEFGSDEIALKITPAPPHTSELDENGESVSRRTVIPGENAEITEISIPYDRVSLAIECSHSFYIFPVDEEKRALDTVICDKTQFLRGTPMELRDTLARKCGKKFKIKTKKS